MTKIYPERCSVCGCPRKALPVLGDVCQRCGDRLGLPETGVEPSMPRPRRPCARCGHAELLVCIARQRTSVRHLAPLAASYERRLRTTPAESDVLYETRLPDPTAPVGIFVACVCRACGFTEWYALDPKAIPVGAAYGTYTIVIDGPEPPDDDSEDCSLP